jgi:hypothetical protein
MASVKSRYGIRDDGFLMAGGMDTPYHRTL